MPAENVQAFLEKLNSDETLLNQIAEAGDDEVRLQMAREAGYEFTAEEFNNVVTNMAGAVDEELSEDQLEAVAGGGLEYDNNHTGPKSSFFRDLQKKYTEVEWTY